MYPIIYPPLPANIVISDFNTSSILVTYAYGDQYTQIVSAASFKRRLRLAYGWEVANKIPEREISLPSICGIELLAANINHIGANSI